MKKCPKCGEKTLKTAFDEIKIANANIQGIGDYMGCEPWRTSDDWSCCSERCTNHKCNYIR